jgi:hypothetical protein
MAKTDGILDAIASAEAKRASRQVAADQAVDHRNVLIRDAVSAGLDKASIASAASLSVAQVEQVSQRYLRRSGRAIRVSGQNTRSARHLEG